MDKKTKNYKTNAQGNQVGPPNTDLKFAQINLHHCKKATYTYCRDLTKEHTDVSFILEPWIRGIKIHGFGQLHNRLFYSRTGGKPRAAIHVSPNLNAMILNQFSDADVVSVRICRKSDEGGDFVVVSAYMPYGSAVPPPGPSIEKIVNFCKKERIPLIIGTDSNAHHIIWGSTDVNERGEELVQYLLTTDLMVLNKGSKPTFVNAIREKRLDVTLASSVISDQIHSWRVTDEETFSDHKLIKFYLKGSFPQRKPFRNPRKTDWNLYRAILTERLSNSVCLDRYSTIEELEKANEECTAAMVNAFEAACPLINPKPMYKAHYGVMIWTS